MPKDWITHRAIIEKLYVSKHLPLETVRRILQNKHGFNASIRAYRMKFVEWGIWKYNKASKRCRRDKSLSPETTSSVESTAEHTELWSNYWSLESSLQGTISTLDLLHDGTLALHDDVINREIRPHYTSSSSGNLSLHQTGSTEIASQEPDPPVDISALDNEPICAGSTMILSGADANTTQVSGDYTGCFPFQNSQPIEGTQATASPLEILLRNWNLVDDPLVQATAVLKSGASILQPLSPGITIFDLVNDNVPSDTQSALISAMLRSDLRYGPLWGSVCLSHWGTMWHLACHSIDWKDAKSHVIHSELWIPQQIRQVFRKCALAVIAESHLKYHRSHVEIHRKIGYVRDPKLRRSLYAGYMSHRESYLVILQDCRDLDLDINPNWYRDLVDLMYFEDNHDDWQEYGQPQVEIAGMNSSHGELSALQTTDFFGNFLRASPGLSSNDPAAGICE